MRSSGRVTRVAIPAGRADQFPLRGLLGEEATPRPAVQATSEPRDDRGGVVGDNNRSAFANAPDVLRTEHGDVLARDMGSPTAAPLPGIVAVPAARDARRTDQVGDLTIEA